MSAETDTRPPLNDAEAWEWILDKVENLSKRVKELEELVE